MDRCGPVDRHREAEQRWHVWRGGTCFRPLGRVLVLIGPSGRIVSGLSVSMLRVTGRGVMAVGGCVVMRLPDHHVDQALKDRVRVGGIRPRPVADRHQDDKGNQQCQHREFEPGEGSMLVRGTEPGRSLMGRHACLPVGPVGVVFRLAPTVHASHPGAEMSRLLKSSTAGTMIRPALELNAAPMPD